MEGARFEEVGCVFFPSGNVIVGDPMLGREVYSICNISNVCVGRWRVLQKRKQGEDKRAVIVLENCLSHIKRTLAYQIKMETISGYIGIFDKRHYQAGNNKRCQKWFRYCQRSIKRNNNLGIVTGGFVMYKIYDDNELQCYIYQNSQSEICCFVVE